MKKIYTEPEIEKALSLCRYADALRAPGVPLFLIEYEPGESISSSGCFQAVTGGTLSIEFIRDDGSAYSLSVGGENFILGDMELFDAGDANVVAQAADAVTVIAVDTALHKDALLDNAAFLRLTAASLALKMKAITGSDASPSSLPERVINYMKYRCDDLTLCGIEKAAFRLHCSAKQLQRILNRFESENLVTKTGKGRYVLNR